MNPSETNRIEYKRQLTDDIEKEVVAFLNYSEGGFIYIGIDKDGNTVGVDDADGLQLTLKNRIKTNILPSAMGLFDIIVEQRDNKEIVKIIVASGSEKPYYLRKYGMSEKGCYIRVGSASEPMTAKQIEYLFSKRVRNSLGNIRSPRQDLTFEQLKIYYQAAGKSLNNQFAKNLELLTSDGKYNYVAYLMADVNGMSMKVAKYNGTDRVHLTENYEFGYCSLVKATKQILDKVELENKTFATITSKERIETRLWNMVALREAIVNSIVHNDYTREVPPKFEFFDDRFEITSYGTLPEGLSEEDFFEGVSMPRNKEIMRIFRDLELVEHLGSGVPRILQSYNRESFRFLDNFVRMSFPVNEQAPNKHRTSTEQDNVIDNQSEKNETYENNRTTIEQVPEQVKSLISIMGKGEYSTSDLMAQLQLKHRPTFIYNYMQPALKAGLIEMTIPDKPNSKYQRYRLTEKGKEHEL